MEEGPELRSLKSIGLRVACLTTLGLPLAACLTPTPPSDLALSTPEAYRQAQRRAAAPVARDWPRLFGSAELTKLSEIAQAENLDIRAAIARIKQAEAQYVLSSAALYPQLTTSDNASRSQSSGALRSKTGPFRNTVNNNFSLGLSASYEIDFWGRNRDRSDAAKLQAEATEADRDTVALSTAASLTNSYFEVLAAQDRLAIARDNIRTAERVLEGIKGRLAVGTTSGLEIAQQETVVAQQRSAVPPLAQAVEQTKNTIAVLMGRTPESVRIVGGSLNRLRAPAIKPGLPSELLLRRPDVAAAEDRLIAAGANVEVARKAFLPSIQLTGNGGLESLVIQNLFRPEAAFGSVTAGLTQTIFDGGTRQGQLDLERGLQEELLQTYRSAIISAFSDVENALIAVRLTSEHERLQILAVAASRKAYQITEQRLREGTIDILTVLNTQQSLFQAQDQLSQIRLQRFQAYSSLFQALGGGWTRPPELVTSIGERPAIINTLDRRPPAPLVPITTSPSRP